MKEKHTTHIDATNPICVLCQNKGLIKLVDLLLPQMLFSCRAAIDCFIKNGYVYTTHINIKKKEKHTIHYDATNPIHVLCRSIFIILL